LGENLFAKCFAAFLIICAIHERGKMTVLGFLLLLLIAAIAGAIAQALVGYSLGGCVVSTVVGLIGALIGYWLADGLGLPLILPIQIDGTTFPLVWSIIGAVIFVAVISVLGRRRPVV
jgi:uncharacterized membrane protein YeaQ/YmgE (transglycosylase-associated protein family)